MTAAVQFVDSILPEFRVRHIFTAKLRLVAFIGFWALYLYFFRHVLGQTKVVAVIVFASFILTGAANYAIMRGRLVLPSLALGLFGDLTAITAVLYLTGGPHSPYYTIYLFYVIIAGVLYNHYLAGVVALSAAAFYGAFLALCHQGIIPPFIIDWGDRLPVVSYTPAAHFVFAILFLAGIVYVVGVASFFSQQRERTLEKRNREMTALHRMSSTIRTTTELSDVIDRLLASVLEGLGFEAAALVHLDWQRGMARLYVPRRHPRFADLKRAVGRPIEGLEFPIGGADGPAIQELKKHRIIFRRELSEFASWLGGAISAPQLRDVQEILGARRIVVMPIMVEEKVLGALVGFSVEPFVEDGQIATMESFANQSALLLEAAALIDRLRRVNEELEEANRVKSEFLATMSHELRTPLTAIIGFSELLVEGVMGELTEEQSESLGEVLHNAADLLDLINSLLDLTKIESGKMRLDLSSFDLAETVRRVSATIVPLTRKKGQDLAVEISDGDWTVLGDERKIQQVVINLIANANKFTSDGGRIEIALRRFASFADVAQKLPAWCGPTGAAHNFPGGGVWLSVDDNGIGIGPEHLELVFDMFHQVDGSVTRSFGGTGVGLALARKFVEMHGGLIWAESERGQGARFSFVIPFSAAIPDAGD